HQVGYGQKGELSFTIDRQGAVMKRKLSCGLAVSMALPANCFKGVAAQAVESPDGEVTATLELHHHDPALSVPLLVSGDLDDIAADWHSWSRMMNLPMLIIESDNVARKLTDRLGALMLEAPIERRKRFATLKHRPWFLRRRKVGVVGEVTKITGEEIIARR
ncbi:MAG: DUF6101 family protein, partial [Pseudomonadota bacterium]